MPIKTPTINPSATHDRCKSCSQGKNGTPEHVTHLQAELGKLALQRAAITRQMDDIKAALAHCTTCCSNTSLMAFVQLREEGLTWSQACNALHLKSSALRSELNQRFVTLARRLQEPWAKNLPHQERVVVLIRDHGLATLKLSLLNEAQFQEAVTHLATKPA